MPKPSAIVSFGIFDFTLNPTFLIVGDSDGIASLARFLEMAAPSSLLLPEWLQPLNGYELTIGHATQRSILSVSGLAIDWKISTDAAAEYVGLLRSLSACKGPAHQYLEAASAYEICVSKDEYTADFLKRS